MHYEILDEKRKRILLNLSKFKGRFYLAGGTALALHLGHRDSIDFDFFTQQEFDENKLIAEIEDLFTGQRVTVIQLESKTVTFLIDNEIKISFFYYKYSLLEILFSDEYFDIASVIDIACMKLSAICSRSVTKDYIDLYFIVKEYDLSLLLEKCKSKFVSLDTSVVIKSLVYFDELEEEPVIMILEKDLSFEKVKQVLVEKTLALKTISASFI